MELAAEAKCIEEEEARLAQRRARLADSRDRYIEMRPGAESYAADLGLSEVSAGPQARSTPSEKGDDADKIAAFLHVPANFDEWCAQSRKGWTWLKETLGLRLAPETVRRLFEGRPKSDGKGADPRLVALLEARERRRAERRQTREAQDKGRWL